MQLFLNLVVKFCVNSFRNTVYMTALYDGSVSSALNYDFYVKSDEPCTVYILCYRDWHWYFNVKHLSCVIWNLTWVTCNWGYKIWSKQVVWVVHRNEWKTNYNVQISIFIIFDCKWLVLKICAENMILI